MFKTIEQCRLDLVAHSVMAGNSDDNQPAWMLEAEQSLDYFPCSAARVSFGKEDKTGANPAADVKLMEYLAEHQHMSPFEHQSATFLIECPLFIRSQIHRHRTFAYNEISRRYTEENLEFWIPTTFRGQATNNRQASEGELELKHVPGYAPTTGTLYFPPVDTYGKEKTLRQHQCGFPNTMYEHALDSLYFYESMLAAGVAREQARAVLPQSLLTKFYMTGNLRNWVHFVKLRKDPHAQQEVRVIAERIEAELIKLWPTAAGVLLRNGKGSSEEAP